MRGIRTKEIVYALKNALVWMLADGKEKTHDGSLLDVNDRVSFIVFLWIAPK